jgi:hypothetical protein
VDQMISAFQLKEKIYKNGHFYGWSFLFCFITKQKEKKKKLCPLGNFLEEIGPIRVGGNLCHERVTEQCRNAIESPEVLRFRLVM